MRRAVNRYRYLHSLIKLIIRQHDEVGPCYIEKYLCKVLKIPGMRRSIAYGTHIAMGNPARCYGHLATDDTTELMFNDDCSAHVAAQTVVMVPAKALFPERLSPLFETITTLRERV